MPNSLPPPRNAGPKVTANINFPRKLLLRVARLADERHQKRSPCVVDLVEYALDNLDAAKAERRGTP